MAVPEIAVRNATRGTVLAERARLADGWWGRFRGLMLAEPLAEGEGLVLDPCASIHMFFMRFPIDVVFASRDLRVVAVVEGIRPWRMTRFFAGARLAIELPAGRVRATRTAPGDALLFEGAPCS